MVEDYVTFEQARLITKLGFDCEARRGYYKLPWGSPQLSSWDVCEKLSWEYESVEFCKAPTLAQARKWLGEVKDVNVVSNFKFHKGKVKYSWYIVIITDNGDRGICDDIEKSIYDTYEEALSAGIDKALELLNNKC